MHLSLVEGPAYWVCALINIVFASPITLAQPCSTMTHVPVCNAILSCPKYGWPLRVKRFGTNSTSYAYLGCLSPALSFWLADSPGPLTEGVDGQSHGLCVVRL